PPPPLPLEPPPRVPLVDAGRLGELRGGARPPICERAVQPEAVADVDGEQIECPQRRLEETFHERVATFVGGRERCHACLLRLEFRRDQPMTVPCLTARPV